MEIPRQPRPSTSAFPRTRRARAWPARGGRGTHLYRASGAVSALELKLKIPVPHMHRLSSLAAAALSARRTGCSGITEARPDREGRKEERSFARTIHQS